ncbi:MAG TPA: hypothetical protein DHW82_13750 [Spirochaetia bacterium]|nr:MAG: hypothetical protein A2Y41_09285 [Spirochaetes bacterium GWB1_36_13]HCL58054.1 hypothetical protein [Spirochaetia bacterium]
MKFCEKKIGGISIYMYLIGILLIALSLLLFVFPGNPISNSGLKKYLFKDSGAWVYEIEGVAQNAESMKKEFEVFVKLNYPTHVQEAVKASKEIWNEFISRREKQDAIIYEALNAKYLEDPEFVYFFKQGMREALVKGYLYKSIPNIDKIKDTQYSDDRVFIEELYKKNKAVYDEKKISKDDAIKSLQEVYLNKKKAVIDYLLKEEEDKVLGMIQKKLKIKENQDYFISSEGKKDETKK